MNETSFSPEWVRYDVGGNVYCLATCADNTVYFQCPVCGRLFPRKVRDMTVDEVGLIMSEKCAEICSDCVDLVKKLGIENMSYDEVREKFVVACKEHGIELIGKTAHMGGILKQMAEWDGKRENHG